MRTGFAMLLAVLVLFGLFANGLVWMDYWDDVRWCENRYFGPGTEGVSAEAEEFCLDVCLNEPQAECLLMGEEAI